MPWKGVDVIPSTHLMDVIEWQQKSLPVSSRLIRSLPHPDRTAMIRHVRFTPEAKLFTAGVFSGIVQIWDPATGKELVKVESPPGFLGAGVYALTPTDCKTLFLPLAARKMVPFEKEGKKHYRNEVSGQVRVWDLTTGKEKEMIRPQQGGCVVSACVSPDGATLCTTEYFGGSIENTPANQTRVYDTKTGKSRLMEEGSSQVAFSADSSRIYASLETDKPKPSSVLKVFDRHGKELATVDKIEGQHFDVPQLSPDGTLLALAVRKRRSKDPGSVRVYDLKTNKLVASFESGGKYLFSVLRFSPDSKSLASTNDEGRLTVWDVPKNTLACRHTFKGMACGQGLAFDQTGKRLAVPMRVKSDDDERDPDPRDVPQPRVYLFDLVKGGDPEEIVCPHGWAAAVAFSPDGKTLAFGSAGATHIFDVSK